MSPSGLSQDLIRTGLVITVATLCIATFQWRELAISALNTNESVDDEQQQAQQTIAMATAIARLGYDNLGASWLWLDSIQYRGNDNRPAVGYDLMYPYFDTITDLDPRFLTAYLSGSNTLAFIAAQPRQARQLLEKGIESLSPDSTPEAYRLHIQLGLIEFLLLDNREEGRDAYYEAADWYEEAGLGSAEAANAWRALADRFVDSPFIEAVQFKVWSDLYGSVQDTELRQIILRDHLARLGTVQQRPDGSVDIIPPQAPPVESRPGSELTP